MTDTEKKAILDAVRNSAREMEIAGLDRKHELLSDTIETRTQMLCISQSKEAVLASLWKLAQTLLPDDKSAIWKARGDGFLEGINEWSRSMRFNAWAEETDWSQEL